MVSIMARQYHYLKDPEAIYELSFARVYKAAPHLETLDPAIASIIARVIHASGMADVIDDLVYAESLAAVAATALAEGAPICCDCRMVASGITATDNPIIMTLNDPETSREAKRLATTRSAAAINGWCDHLDGAIVAIGNAPTALFHLLENLADGGPKPAAIFAFPVGFVGAASSKDALIAAAGEIPFITLKGRRGGSAMTAAAVNAAAIIAAKRARS